MPGHQPQTIAEPVDEDPCRQIPGMKTKIVDLRVHLQFLLYPKKTYSGTKKLTSMEVITEKMSVPKISPHNAMLMFEREQWTACLYYMTVQQPPDPWSA